MALVLNGDGNITGLLSGGLPDGSVTADDIASTLDLSGKTVTLPAGTGGKVLQVVNYIYSGEVSTTGDWIDTGLTVTITPSSVSSKILVNVHQTGISNNSANSGVKLRLMRNSTTLLQFENGAAYQSGDNDVGGSGITYLDSPATTSATTYKTQFGKGAGSSGTAKVGHYGVSSGITVMEIAA